MVEGQSSTADYENVSGNKIPECIGVHGLGENAEKTLWNVSCLLYVSGKASCIY